MVIKVEKLGFGCKGIGHINGKTIFISSVLPGEEVDVLKTEEKRGVLFSDDVNIISSSPLRVISSCPLYGVCGGCNFNIVDECSSATLKEEIVKDSLKRFPWFKNLVIEEKVYGNFLGYRSRVRVHVNLGTKEQGFLKSNSSSLVPISSCPALKDNLNKLLSKRGGAIYERAREKMFTGDVNRDTGFVEVPLFSGDNDISLGNNNVNVKVKDINYSVNANVFFQSNITLLPELLSYVKENTVGDEIVDLYSGVGTFSSLFNNEDKKVYAIEKDDRCLKLSKINAPRAISITSDAEKWIKNNALRPDTLIVDPPRGGLGREVVHLIEDWTPKRIIYISCNPVTLIRDLTYFSSYIPRKMKVFDFYPGSEHIETAFVLTI